MLNNLSLKNLFNQIQIIIWLISLSVKFDININVDLIEVYDNSHIQGSDSIGALICFGKKVS